MKKILLSGLAALTAATASAFSPQVIEEAYITKFSPDKKYFASFMNGNIGIFETETGEMVASFGDVEMPYSLGDGNCFATDGTFVGGTSYGAAYCKDYEWTQLDIPNPEFSSYAHAITPDCKSIVGIVGMAPISTEDTSTPMMVPAIWDLQDDGTYSDAKILPYPELDFTGRVPQYVTVLDITADGKKAFGQVVDYQGSMVALIVYTRKDDNTWTYSVANDLLNPNHVAFPEWPGEAPSYPVYTNYMTEEEMAAYDEACANWDWESGEEYPAFADFMSETERAAWEAALEAWQNAQDEWFQKFQAFNAVYEQVQTEGKTLLFNNLIVSADEKKVISTNTIIEDDPTSWLGFSENKTPIIIDVETFEATRKTPKNITVTGVTEDMTIFGFNADSYRYAAIYLPDADEPISLLEYYAGNEEMTSFIKENMYHDVESYNWDTGEFETIHDVEITGTPIVTPDASIIGTAAQNDWNYDLPVSMYTFILPGLNTAVNNITDNASTLSVSALKNGCLKINGEAETVMVYDINGALVYKANKPASVVETGLNAGAYIVKVTSKENNITLKVIF